MRGSSATMSASLQRAVRIMRDAGLGQRVGTRHYALGGVAVFRVNIRNRRIGSRPLFKEAKAWLTTPNDNTRWNILRYVIAIPHMFLL